VAEPHNLRDDGRANELDFHSQSQGRYLHWRCAAAEPFVSLQEEEIQWILKEIQKYLAPDLQIRRSDVLSAWSGIRPLVKGA
jgi:hypothetical protein